MIGKSNWKYYDEVMKVMDEINQSKDLSDIPMDVPNHIKYEVYEYWKRLYPKEDWKPNPFEEYKPTDGWECG